MFYYKSLISFFSILSVFILVGCASNLQTHNLSASVVLQDEVNNIDGLDNPRTAKFNNDDTQLFIASSDDDSLAIFDVTSDFELSLSQIFKNDENITGLRGATKVAISQDGIFAYVVSFYDSALVIFKKADDGKFYYQHTYSDKIKWWENKGKSIASSLQTLALLGAYDIEINHIDNQLYIASSVSNALSIFNINKDGFPIFSHAFRDTDNINYGLEGNVDVLLSPSGSTIFSAGYNENAITVFSKTDNNKFHMLQTLINNTNGIKHLDKPQSMTMSSDGKTLYVACGNGSIVVFNQNKMGGYSYLQSITDVGKTVLNGAGSIAISADDKTLYITSEADNAISKFSRNSDGTLNFITAKTNTDVNDNSLLGASSVNLSSDGKHLVVTAGKGNALSIIEIN
jgi:6-phosphogluconolactonase (cycloisomerase 2 family)